MNSKYLIPLVVLSFISAMSGSVRGQMVNIAPDGTPIFGYNTGGAALTTLGTNYTQYGGTTSTLNDGTTTSESTPNTDFGNSGSYGYAGYTSLAIPAGDQIVSLNLYMYAFGDGGWFGPNDDTSSNNPLQASDLSAPIVQVTTDNGTTWTQVADTNNYLSQYTNEAYRGSNLPEVTLTLDTPLTGIDGIRVIGTNGGYATNNTNPGFIAVNELQVEAVPEPSTYAMMLGGLVLLGFCLRRRLAPQT